MTRTAVLQKSEKAMVEQCVCMGICLSMLKLRRLRASGLYQSSDVAHWWSRPVVVRWSGRGSWSTDLQKYSAFADYALQRLETLEKTS